MCSREGHSILREHRVGRGIGFIGRGRGHGARVTMVSAQYMDVKYTLPSPTRVSYTSRSVEWLYESGNHEGGASHASAGSSG